MSAKQGLTAAMFRPVALTTQVLKATIAEEDTQEMEEIAMVSTGTTSNFHLNALAFSLVS